MAHDPDDPDLNDPDDDDGDDGDLLSGPVSAPDVARCRVARSTPTCSATT